MCQAPNSLQSVDTTGRLLTSQSFHKLADDKEEAYVMRDACEKVQKALAEVGYNPR